MNPPQQQQQNFRVAEKENTYGSNLDTALDCETDLKLSYNLPGHPIAFAGVNNIYDFYHGKLSKEKIKNILSGIENYTIHREYHKGQRNPSYAHFKRYQFQIDLIDVQALSQYNDGCRFLLAAIDTFTRYAWIRMLTTKHAAVVLEAFQSILRQAGEYPKIVVIDRGTEWYNKLFQTFCKDNNIKLFAPDSSIHAGFIERFNRTFQSLLYKYLTENETYRYVDKVDKEGNVIQIMSKLVATYNNRKHRMIGTTPFIAENDPSSHLNIQMLMSKYHETIKKKPQSFQLGDLVRIAKQKTKFSRGYKEQSQQEIFKIHAIKSTFKIPMYILSSYNGKEIIKGAFYSFELTKVDAESEDIFRIEKVLRTRKRNNVTQHFVKWKSFDDSHNSWIDAEDITRKFL